MIDYILQIEGENVLQVHYKSGFNRYCYLGDWDYIMTKTQRKFMEKAMVLRKHVSAFNRGLTYWIDKNNPNKHVVDYVNRENEEAIYE